MLLLLQLVLEQLLWALLTPDVASAAAGVGTACVGPVGPLDAASAAAGGGWNCPGCVVPADPDAASAAADVGTAWVAIAAAVGGAELGGAAGAKRVATPWLPGKLAGC